MTIGPYTLGEPVVSGRDLKEISFFGYLFLHRMFKREHIYRAPDVALLGFRWNMMLATIDDRIYKISAQFVSAKGGNILADLIYSHAHQYCTEQFGAPDGNALGYGAEWTTPFGNIVLDQRSAFGRFCVNFQCTDVALVRSTTLR